MLKRIIFSLAFFAGALSAAYGQSSVFQQNQVYAGPTSGSGHAAPRLLVGADLPNPAAGTKGGVKSLVCSAHQWLNSVDTSGSLNCAQPAVADISGFGTGVATALGINVGSAGAPVLFNGALGTPSSGTLTNATGLPTTGLTGTLQAAQEPAHTGDCTNSAGSLALACTNRQIISLLYAGFTQPQNTTEFVLSTLGTVETNVQALCPRSGTFKNLYLQSSAPASGQTITATWRINNSDTGLTCTITGTGTTCNDTTHTAACTAGQSYSLKTVTSATTGTITSLAGGVEFDN